MQSDPAPETALPSKSVNVPMTRSRLPAGITSAPPSSMVKFRTNSSSIMGLSAAVNVPSTVSVVPDEIV